MPVPTSATIVMPTLTTTRASASTDGSRVTPVPTHLPAPPQRVPLRQ
ncbi:MAG: hypothetical protein IPK33_11200 [Gemmatimonadetes bacterium]|nr:hypothetical protein [Gemmatimonadota bacterium]